MAPLVRIDQKKHSLQNYESAINHCRKKNSNLYIRDPGQQAIKINQNSAKTFSVNFGRVTRSRIELSENGRNKVWQINGSCYTGGIDAHHAAGWQIDNNIIEGFWCSGGLAEHGVHFWSFSRDTLVEKNRVINCDRGIGFGLGSSGHNGGSHP